MHRYFRPRSAKRKPPVVKEGESDGADGQTGIRKHRKKRSPPPGYVPFKQIIIPEHWKLFPESKFLKRKNFLKNVKNFFF